MSVEVLRTNLIKAHGKALNASQTQSQRDWKQGNYVTRQHFGFLSDVEIYIEGQIDLWSRWGQFSCVDRTMQKLPGGRWI